MPTSAVDNTLHLASHHLTRIHTQHFCATVFPSSKVFLEYRFKFHSSLSLSLQLPQVPNKTDPNVESEDLQSTACYPGVQVQVRLTAAGVPLVRCPRRDTRPVRTRASPRAHLPPRTCSVRSSDRVTQS